MTSSMNPIVSFTRFLRQQLSLPRLAALSLAAVLSSCGNVVYPLDPPALLVRLYGLTVVPYTLL